MAREILPAEGADVVSGELFGQKKGHLAILRGLVEAQSFAAPVELGGEEQKLAGPDRLVDE